MGQSAPDGLAELATSLAVILAGRAVQQGTGRIGQGSACPWWLGASGRRDHLPEPVAARRDPSGHPAGDEIGIGAILERLHAHHAAMVVPPSPC